MIALLHVQYPYDRDSRKERPAIGCATNSSIQNAIPKFLGQMWRKFLSGSRLICFVPTHVPIIDSKIDNTVTFNKVFNSSTMSYINQDLFQMSELPTQA